MGLGFVLFVWALLLGAVAFAAAIVLGVWTWWNHNRVLGRPVLFKTLAAAALPFLLLGYGAATFAAYAIWCETIRGVDAGIGDVWQVPIGNDHYFCMIDVPDKGYLLKGGCTGSPPVSDITELAAAADLIVGNSASNGPFVLDTRTDAVRSFATVDAALNELTPRPILQSAWAFYDDRRWGRADILVAVLIGLPAIAVTLGWYFWFIRVRPAVINPR